MDVAKHREWASGTVNDQGKCNLSLDRSSGLLQEEGMDDLDGSIRLVWF